MKNKKLIFVISIIALVALGLFLSINIIDPTERAVKVHMGKVVGEVHGSGTMFKIPGIETIRRFDLAPKQMDITFNLDEKSAVSKDMQSIGVSATIFYKYEENRLLDIVNNYSTQSINDIFTSALKESIKDEVGKYRIYDIIAAQDTIKTKVKENVIKKIAEHPIRLVDLNLTNWDWSDDFDKQIEQTMKVAQEAKREEQNTAKQEAINNREKGVAQKNKSVAITNAEAELEAAKKRADAIRAEADAIAYKNEKVAKNINIEIRLRELEIEKIKASRWDGAYVPNNMYGPIPVDYRGGVQGR